MLAFGALHVIAASILFNTDIALRTIFSVSTDVVGCFRVICTFGEPFPDGSTVCGCMVHLPTLKAEDLIATIALHSPGFWLLYLYDHRAICTRTQLQLVMALHIVPEEVAPVFVFQLFTRQQWKNKVFGCPKQAVLSHAGDPNSDTILDKHCTMLLPAAATELVLTSQRKQVLLPDKLHAHCAVMGGMYHCMFG